MFFLGRNFVYGVHWTPNQQKPKKALKPLKPSKPEEPKTHFKKNLSFFPHLVASDF